MIRIMCLILLMPLSSVAASIQPGDQVTIPSRTIYNDGNLAEPDSVRIHVFYGGSEVFDSWFNSADAEAFTNDGWMIFADQFGDIDGAGGAGPYLILARAYDADSSLYTPFVYHFQIGLTDSVYAIIDTLQNHDDWVSSLSEVDRIGIDLDNVFGTLDSSEIADGAITGPHLSTSVIDLVWDEDTTGHYTPGAYGYEAAQSGTADSASVSRWVWNAPQGNHTIGGTFGSYLDATVSGIGSGSGLYAYGIIAYDSTLGQVIPGVRLAVRNLDQSALIAVGLTESDGWATFSLDADSYLVSAFSTGYLFDAWDTVVVTGDDADTVFGVQFDPGEPAWPDMCRVYGHVYSFSGVPIEGATVTARLPGGVVTFQDVIISPSTVSVTTDESGQFLIDLIASNYLSPVGTLYEFTISHPDGTILRQRLSVPDADHWRMVW